MTPKKRIRTAGNARREIAQTFAALHKGHLIPSNVLESPPRCLERIRIYDVLRRFPHMGRDGADKLLRRLKIWPTTPLGKLTEEERHSIAENLPPRVEP